MTPTITEILAEIDRLIDKTRGLSHATTPPHIRAELSAKVAAYLYLRQFVTGERR